MAQKFQMSLSHSPSKEAVFLIFSLLQVFGLLCCVQVELRYWRPEKIMDCCDLPWWTWALPESNNWEKSRSPNNNPKLWLSACRRKNFYSFGPHCLDPVLQRGWRLLIIDVIHAHHREAGWQRGQDWPALGDQKHFVTLSISIHAILRVCSFVFSFVLTQPQPSTSSLNMLFFFSAKLQRAKRNPVSTSVLCTPETFVAVNVVVP